MAYSVEWEEKGVICVFTDHLDEDDLERANSEIYEDIRFDSLSYSLWDFSDVSHCRVSEFAIEYSAATDKGASLTNTSIIKVFIAPNKHTRAVVEIYAATSKRLKTTWTLQSFGTIKEALAWIDTQ